MEVARTFMIHAAAPHFLWPFVVRYAAHQLNLWPRVSALETSPTLRWTGHPGDASSFRVWDALSLVRNTKASKLSPRTLRCVFLGFPTNAPPWQFYHPASRRVLSSQDVTFDESACYYRLHPHASHPVPSRLSSWCPGGGGYGPAGAGATIPVGTAGAGGAGGTTRGATSAGGTGGARPGGAAGAGGIGAAAGAGGTGAASVGGTAGAVGTGAAGAGGTTVTGYAGGAGATGTGGAGGTTGAGGARARAGGTGGAGGTTGARGVGAVGARGAGGAGATGAGGVAGGTGGATRAGGTGADGALCHLLSLPPGATDFPVAGTTPPLLFPPADQSQPPLLPHSPLPALAPYTAVTQSLTERREPETRVSIPERREPESSFDLEPEPSAAVRARVPRVHRPHAPAVPGTHDMTLRPSSVPHRVVLPLPPASSLPGVADLPSDLARASSPTITRFLATVVTDPTFSSPAASALVAELVDFADVYRLD
ncbi:unnamed protein product [Closterium sp. NIES-64]|nr:unnamed protein product [Closterium sp. NIES-64]